MTAVLENTSTDGQGRARCRPSPSPCGSRATTPRSTAEPHYEDYQVTVARHRPRARRAAPDQVGAGRLAVLPPLLRPRRLRLGRDADQRQEPARLQDADQGRQPGQADHRRADQGPSRREGPDRRHGAVLRGLPRGHAVPRHQRPTSPPRSGCRARPTSDRFDDTTKCILCAACTSACPVFWSDGQYFGPAAIVNAHRFIFDSRDDAADASGWRSSTTARACGAAAPSSTAPRRARAASRSPRRSRRSSGRSSPAASDGACLPARRLRREGYVGLDAPPHRPVRALALSLLLGATGAVGVPAGPRSGRPGARPAAYAAAAGAGRRCAARPQGRHRQPARRGARAPGRPRTSRGCWPT